LVERPNELSVAAIGYVQLTVLFTIR